MAEVKFPYPVLLIISNTVGLNIASQAGSQHDSGGISSDISSKGVAAVA